MRIAIMLRAMDQDSGFRAYIDGLVEHMLTIDAENSYLLLYRTPKWHGRFSAHKHAKEVLLWAPHKLAWDQIAVPYRAWREGADIIFNPKFSVPLVSSCPVAMGLQEPEWWASPQFYERFDQLYMRTMLPIYCRKASYFFPMSQFDLDESRKYLRLPLTNSTVTYTCPGRHMKPINDVVELGRFREQYALPERFILSVTRVDHPGLDHFDQRMTFFPGKNPETILRAFLLCRDAIPHHLVFAGRRVRDYLVHLGFNNDDFARVHFITFVPYQELPRLYNAAEMSVVSAYYDGCSTTMLESMACGCPVISSTTGACPELGEGASLYADPHDPADFAAKIRLIATDDRARRDLAVKSLERVAYFDWTRMARMTLDGLVRAARTIESSRHERDRARIQPS